MSKNLNLIGSISDAAIMNNVDWDTLAKDGKILKYADRNNSKLTKFQLEMIDLYEGKKTSLKEVVKGSVITGIIKSITRREMVIDINYKDDVFVEHKLSDWNIISGFNVGDEVDVLIKEVQEKPYVIKGSVIDLLRMSVVDKVVDHFNNNIPIVGLVTEVIPAGFILNLELNKIILPAFMPNTLADVNRLHDPSVLMGKRINVMIETLQQEKGVYVVSRKKYLNTLIPEKIKSLDFNKVYEGYVTGTTPFGVFVQFEGCLTGMIYKMNINSEYRDKISEIKSGTQIVFYIKEITNKNKIILTQTLEESMWDTLTIGAVMKGEVVSIKPFGTLVKLDYETIGLLQSSYLARNKRLLKVGEMIDVKVMNVLKDDRKIHLSFADTTQAGSVNE